MNIEQAKRIPLADILEKIGHSPAQEKKGEAFYSSPLRVEKTPSFHVNHAKNCWYDFGHGSGGNPVDFAIAYLESRNKAHRVPDALRWLNDLSGAIALIPSAPQALPNREPKLVVKQKTPIRHRALIGYLNKRGIPLPVAAHYVVEVRVLNLETNKIFFALGFPNEEKGYEVRNPYFKGCAGAKGVSFIRGTKPKQRAIHLFEGGFDYLSAVAFRNTTRLDDDAIILHSLSCLKQAMPYIRNYGYRVAYTWLDNDKAGTKGTNTLAEFFKSEENLRHKPMNGLYLPHKDVNAWHMHKLHLSP